MDFDDGADVKMACPIKSHREKSEGNFYIPVDCDTWPECPVCGRNLKAVK